MTGEQRAVVRTLLAVLAIVVGTIGVVHFWPDSGSADQPVVLATSSTSSSATLPSTTSTAVHAPSSTVDELQAAIDAYKAAVVGDSADPYGPANGVFTNPEGGRWAEVNRDVTCRWSLVDDPSGGVFESGQGDVVVVPAQISEFRTEPRCSWAYLPER